MRRVDTWRVEVTGGGGGGGGSQRITEMNTDREREENRFYVLQQQHDRVIDIMAKCDWINVTNQHSAD